MKIDINHEVLDPITYITSEMATLEGEIPVKTKIGDTLMNTLILHGGMQGAQEVVHRQQAVEQFAADPDLLEETTSILARYREDEEAAFHYANAETQTKLPDEYRAMSRAASAVHDLAGLLDQTPTDNEYLQTIFDRVTTFDGTELEGLLRGPIYNTPLGVRSKDALPPLMPRLRFKTGLTGRLGALTAANIAAVDYDLLPPESLMPVGMFFLMNTMSMMGSPVNWDGRRGYNTGKNMLWNHFAAYSPVQKRIDASSEYSGSLISIAELDTITALASLKRTMEQNGHATTYPEVNDDAQFSMIAEGLKNPLLAAGDEFGRRSNRVLVPNDIEIGTEGNELTFVTGPNSGGKSTMSKSVVQSIILGGLGGAVPADRLEFSLPDKVFYHVPMAPELGEEAGRFQHEMNRMKKIIDVSTARTLAVLDDCVDGTTHDERMSVLKDVMFGFRYMVGATMFSTHAHEVVTQFQEHGEGNFLQVEFNGEDPTHLLIPGVSHISHAGRVAKIVGLTEPQIREMLAHRNIDDPEWF